MIESKSVFICEIGMSAILVKDPKDLGWTIYLEGMERVVSEGDTEEDAIEKIKYAYKVISEYEKSI